MNPATRLAQIDDALLDLTDLLRTVPVRHPIAKAALRKAINALVQASMSLNGAALAEGSEDEDPAPQAD